MYTEYAQRAALDAGTQTVQHHAMAAQVVSSRSRWGMLWLPALNARRVQCSTKRSRS
ncbi:hypothetical protein ACCP84_01540 [Xanthomonas axonopodis pv. ricini]